MLKFLTCGIPHTWLVTIAYLWLVTIAYLWLTSGTKMLKHMDENGPDTELFK